MITKLNQSKLKKMQEQVVDIMNPDEWDISIEGTMLILRHNNKEQMILISAHFEMIKYLSTDFYHISIFNADIANMHHSFKKNRKEIIKTLTSIQ